jgi:hypothetical protein
MPKVEGLKVPDYKKSESMGLHFCADFNKNASIGFVLFLSDKKYWGFLGIILGRLMIIAGIGPQGKNRLFLHLLQIHRSTLMNLTPIFLAIWDPFSPFSFSLAIF